MENQTLGLSGPNPVAEEQFRKGFELAKQGDADGACLAIEAAIAISPDDSRYHDLLGTLYAKRGVYEMAVAEWKRSIECDPDHAEVFRRIETAEKMRARAQVAGNRLNWLALSVLAVAVVAGAAAATWFHRSARNAKAQLADALEQVASAQEGMVDMGTHEALLAEKVQAASKVTELAARVGELTKKVEEYQTSSVPKSELDREKEVRAKIQSELAAARKIVDEMKPQIEAIRSASGAQSLALQVRQKEETIQSLDKQYKSLYDQHKQTEAEHAKTKEQLASLRAHVADLEEQSAKLLSATDSTKLRAENRQLKDQLAQGGGAPPGGAGDREVSLLLNPVLEAVRYTLEGRKAEAAAKLKSVQAKVPEGVPIVETIAALSAPIGPTPTPAAAAVEKAVEKPTEKATPKPTKVPSKEPTKARAKPEPEPTKKAKPTASPTPGRAVASARQVRRLDEKEPTGREVEKSDPKAELYERKKRLRDQALALYKQRKFGEAARVIDQAYRIDPKDPGVLQLRDAIRNAGSN
ncbi:MAG: hypothetical protein GHCLOJNM_04477 [bacterium]|nr:hypothetical protein [bacterium]